MDHWKNGSEKNRGIRDLVLKEDVENQMEGKGEKRGSIQRNRRRNDSMEHHTFTTIWVKMSEDRKSKSQLKMEK
jgi:hypothetical protein